MTLNHNGFFLHCMIIKCDFLSRNFAFITPVQQLDLIVAAQNNAYSSPDTAHHTVYLKIAAGGFQFSRYQSLCRLALPVLKAASMICIMDGTARKSKLSTEKVQCVPRVFPFRCIVYT